jgi:hypothetical protein
MTYNLDIQFTSIYAGTHRVCWRIGSSGPYNCATTVVCLGGGATCSTTVPILMSDLQCESVLIEGYVQPDCVDVGSEDSRTYFTSIFYPEPPCGNFLVACNSVEITGVTVTDPGSGYTPSSSISWTTSGGGGAGAYGTATIDLAGSVDVITVTDGGSGYTSAPTIIFATSPGGDTATGTGILGQCPIANLGEDCGGVTVSVGPSNVGTDFSVCYNTAPIATGWDVSESGCCYTCSTVEFENTGLSNDTVYYISCSTLAWTTLVLNPSDVVTVCAVTNSWTGIGPNTTVTVTPGCLP